MTSITYTPYMVVVYLQFDLAAFLKICGDFPRQFEREEEKRKAPP